MLATRCPHCTAPMTVSYSGAWICLRCRAESSFRFAETPTRPNTAFHLAACVLTAGLWLPVYIALLGAYGVALRRSSQAPPTLSPLHVGLTSASRSSESSAVSGRSGHGS